MWIADHRHGPARQRLEVGIPGDGEAPRLPVQLVRPEHRQVAVEVHLADFQVVKDLVIRVQDRRIPDTRGDAEYRVRGRLSSGSRDDMERGYDPGSALRVLDLEPRRGPEPVGIDGEDVIEFLRPDRPGRQDDEDQPENGERQRGG